MKREKLILWAGAAADVSDNWDGGNSPVYFSVFSFLTPVFKENRGRLFCFLPLPAHTSLPVHLNGFFELSSDRSSLKGNSTWNKNLIPLIVKSYSSLLMKIHDILLQDPKSQR